MEFDLNFFSKARKKLTVRIDPLTLKHLEDFAGFYGLGADQVVNAALNQTFLADSEFVEHLQTRFKTLKD